MKIIFTDICKYEKSIIYIYVFFPVLLTLNVRLQMCKCTPKGKCTPVPVL